MSDFLRIRLITQKWLFEEWNIDSIPNPSLYPLQQGKVHKTRSPKGDYREQGEEENEETENNNDSR
tara:strand:+ start:257 stop:454 length:198 start_codon:yes stop_codon:yes gene_type:complete